MRESKESPDSRRHKTKYAAAMVYATNKEKDLACARLRQRKPPGPGVANRSRRMPKKERGEMYQGSMNKL